VIIIAFVKAPTQSMNLKKGPVFTSKLTPFSNGINTIGKSKHFDFEQLILIYMS